jgi:membrane-associated phospholipid phosphatase
MNFLNGIFELFEQLSDLFWAVGYFSWQIATVYAIYVVYTYDFNYSILFLILFLLSGYLNHVVLKEMIHSLRPPGEIKFLAFKKNKPRNNGMPSGHTQQTAFALTIAYLFTHKNLMLSIGLFLLTVLQRYVFRNHTLSQLFAGGILGVVLGYISFYVMIYLEIPIKKVEKNIIKKIH